MISLIMKSFGVILLENFRIRFRLKMFAVDHCYNTGKVRGLLCFHCNTELGHFQENQENFVRAIEYLKSHA